MWKKKRNEISEDYKRFFEDFYSYFFKNMHNNGLITKESIKKALSDFAMSRHLLYEIKMRKSYRKSLERELKSKIKTEKELAKQQKKLMKTASKEQTLQNLLDKMG